MPSSDADFHTNGSTESEVSLSMLLNSPRNCSAGFQCQEKESHHGLRRYVKSHPLQNVGSAVCTRDGAQQGPNVLVRCCQIPWYDLTAVVRELVQNRDCKSEVHMGFTYRVVVRVVHQICNNSRKCPIIRAIAIYVCKRTSCIAKTVHKDGFEFTCHVMKAPGIEGIGLHRVDKRAFLNTEEGVNLGIIVEDGIDDQWAEILKEKQRSVGKLGS